LYQDIPFCIGTLAFNLLFTKARHRESQRSYQNTHLTSANVDPAAKSDHMIAIELICFVQPAHKEVPLLTKYMKGGTMYAKGALIGLLIVVAAMIAGLLSTGIAVDKSHPVKIYESCLVKKIEKCESLAEMLHTTRSATLRKYAMVQDQKALFLDAEREMLIHAMIQMQLEPKQYKIEHYLDEQFYKYLAK
jgi:hypothetical protein